MHETNKRIDERFIKFLANPQALGPMMPVDRSTILKIMQDAAKGEASRFKQPPDREVVEWFNRRGYVCCFSVVYGDGGPGEVIMTLRRKRARLRRIHS